MCCESKKQFVKEVLASFKGKKVATFYKVYKRQVQTDWGNVDYDLDIYPELTVLQSPYQKVDCKPGLQRSNSKSNPKYRLINRTLERGIHVCRTLEGANNVLKSSNSYGSSNFAIVEVRCERKHLIGASERDAVFMQINLPKEQYEKALNKKV
jgi:hypothetical protein